jgi:vesicle-fusing ATPase
LVKLGNHPFTVEGHAQIQNSEVGLNGLQRRFAQLSLAAPVILTPYQPYPPASLASIVFAVDLLAKSKAPAGAKKHQKEIDTDRLAQTVLMIVEKQVLAVGQVMALDFEGTKVECTVKSVAAMDRKKKSKSKEGGSDVVPLDTTEGQLLQSTDITFAKAEGATGIQLTGDRAADGGGSQQSIFTSDFDFEKLGIGGLDAEFNQIFRRAFASRIWPSKIIKEMGITHVRGMLL